MVVLVVNLLVIVVPRVVDDVVLEEVGVAAGTVVDVVVDVDVVDDVAVVLLGGVIRFTGVLLLTRFVGAAVVL